MVNMNTYNLTLKDSHTPEEMRLVVLLSFQRALLGHIKKNVREIIVFWNNVKDIKVVFILDETPTIEDRELVGDTAGEVHGDFPYKINIKEECVFDSQKIISYTDNNYQYNAIVFLRCE
jgi:hypothetical protein